VGGDARPEADEDVTAVTPTPSPGTPPASGYEPITEPTRPVPPGRPGPARDELAPVQYSPMPVPYTSPQPPAVPPAAAPPAAAPGYPAPAAPPPYPEPSAFPTTGYVPTHAFAAPPPSYDPAPPWAPATPPVEGAPPAYVPAPTPPPVTLPPPPPTPRMDGVAVASLVVSIIGIPMLVVACTGFPLCIIGIIMGFVARHRIYHANGKLTGNGAAMAAIIIGAVGIAFFVLLLVSFLISGSGRTTL
jgi:hypothetical protein